MAEKSLNNLQRDVRVLFTKGQDALQRDNFDYAIDLFNQVLVREPGLYECRKLLRNAQLKKAGGGGGFFKRVLNSASCVGARSEQPNAASARLTRTRRRVPASACPI